jgi:hypothetical protein
MDRETKLTIFRGPDCTAMPGHDVLSAHLLIEVAIHFTLVKQVRAWFERCKQEVVWGPVHGGDHDERDRALDHKSPCDS